MEIGEDTFISNFRSQSLLNLQCTNFFNEVELCNFAQSTDGSNLDRDTESKIIYSQPCYNNNENILGNSSLDKHNK